MPLPRHPRREAFRDTMLPPRLYQSRGTLPLVCHEQSHDALPILIRPPRRGVMCHRTTSPLNLPQKSGASGEHPRHPRRPRRIRVLLKSIPAGETYYLRHLRRLCFSKYGAPAEQSYIPRRLTRRHYKSYYGAFPITILAYTISSPIGRVADGNTPINVATNFF